MLHPHFTYRLSRWIIEQGLKIFQKVHPQEYGAKIRELLAGDKKLLIRRC
jgi:hypothetical protein